MLQHLAKMCYLILQSIIKLDFIYFSNCDVEIRDRPWLDDLSPHQSRLADLSDRLRAIEMNMGTSRKFQEKKIVRQLYRHQFKLCTFDKLLLQIESGYGFYITFISAFSYEDNIMFKTPKLSRKSKLEKVTNEVTTQLTTFIL